MTENTIFWQYQPEFGANHVSAIVDGEFELFTSFNRLSQYLNLTQNDYDLCEVTSDNWQDFQDSGAFHV